jgi:hypothetical protein
MNDRLRNRTPLTRYLITIFGESNLFWKKELTEKERLEKVLDAMGNIYDIANHTGYNVAKQHKITEQVFGFFEKNLEKKTSLGEIFWSDYTRFPRSHAGAILALEVFMEDLTNELKDAD